MISANIYFDDQEEKLMRRPKCSCCDEHIQEDYCVELPNGEILCPDCEYENAHDLWFEWARQDFVRKV